MREKTLRSALAILTLAFPLISGCQTASTGGGAGKRPLVSVDLAENLDTYQVEKVAVLAEAKLTKDPKSDIVNQYVGAALAQSGKYTFTRPKSVEKEAQRHEVGEERARLVEVWEKRRTLNKPDVIELCKAAGFDAVLAYEITSFDQQKIDVNQEGTSKTTVGLNMEMFGSDGTLLWAARSTKVAESIPYNPELHVRSTQKGEARRDESMVPEAPLIEPVAHELVQEVVATLPELNPNAKPAP